MRLRLITAPTEQPITTAEARDHVELGGNTAHDAKLGGMIASATEQLDGPDGILGRALCTQTWQLLLDAFPCADKIEIPLPPLREITSITYVDQAGVTQTMPAGDYIVDIASQPGIVALAYGKQWPAARAQHNAVTIEFEAGYGTAADVPARLKSAIKLHVGALFENREQESSAETYVSEAYDRLVFPFRIIRP